MEAQQHSLTLYFRLKVYENRLEGAQPVDWA